MNEIISQTIQSFDFGYCLVVNVLTYIIIQVLKHYNVTLNTWAILAPVSWSWIFKPLCKTFKVDYND